MVDNNGTEIEVMGLTKRFGEVQAVAGTFSNFFRFPMIFLCGLFFPVSQLPAILQPLSYALPLTYGADLLHLGFGGNSLMPVPLDFGMLLLFCAALFLTCLRNIRRRWIA